MALSPDLRPRPRRKLARIDRPRDIVVHAKVEAAQDALAILGIGDRQHRDLAGALHRSEPGAKPEPVVTREIETDDEKVVIAEGGGVENPILIVDTFDIVESPQGVRDELRRGRTILGDHDAPATAVAFHRPTKGKPNPEIHGAKGLAAQFVKREPRSRQGFNPREERELVDRRGEEIIGAGFESVEQAGRLIECRDHDDRRQTSNPSIPGIITSSKTMSHLPLAQSAKASAPFVAVKTSKYSALSRASISLRLA